MTRMEVAREMEYLPTSVHPANLCGPVRMRLVKLLWQPSKRCSAILRFQDMGHSLPVPYPDSETAEMVVEVYEPALRRLTVREKDLVLGLEEAEPLEENNQYRGPASLVFVRGHVPRERLLRPLADQIWTWHA